MRLLDCYRWLEAPATLQLLRWRDWSFSLAAGMSWGFFVKTATGFVCSVQCCHPDFLSSLWVMLIRVAYTEVVFPFRGLFWYNSGDSVVLLMLACGNVANIFVSLQNVWERKRFFGP